MKNEQHVQIDNNVLRYLYELERNEFQSFRSDKSFYNYNEWKYLLYEKSLNKQKGEY